MHKRKISRVMLILFTNNYTNPQTNKAPQYYKFYKFNDHNTDCHLKLRKKHNTIQCKNLPCSKSSLISPYDIISVETPNISHIYARHKCQKYVGHKCQKYGGGKTIHNWNVWGDRPPLSNNKKCIPKQSPFQYSALKQASRAPHFCIEAAEPW